jgi:hypothetical protein
MPTAPGHGLGDYSFGDAHPCAPPCACVGSPQSYGAKSRPQCTILNRRLRAFRFDCSGFITKEYLDEGPATVPGFCYSRSCRRADRAQRVRKARPDDRLRPIAPLWTRWSHRAKQKGDMNTEIQNADIQGASALTECRTRFHHRRQGDLLRNERPLVHRRPRQARPFDRVVQVS